MGHFMQGGGIVLLSVLECFLGIALVNTIVCLWRYMYGIESGIVGCSLCWVKDDRAYPSVLFLDDFVECFIVVHAIGIGFASVRVYEVGKQLLVFLRVYLLVICLVYVELIKIFEIRIYGTFLLLLLAHVSIFFF